MSGLNKDKFYDAKLARGYCDALKSEYNAFLIKARSVHAGYGDFANEALYHGDISISHKQFMTDGIGSMLTEVTDMQKELVEYQTEIISTFETTVDSSKNARIEYNTLDEIDKDFKGYYRTFKEKATEVKDIVEKLNQEFSEFGEFPQPDKSSAINGFRVICGGSSRDSGHFMECQKKLVKFDDNMTGYLKSKDIASHSADLQSRIDRTAAILGGYGNKKPSESLINSGILEVIDIDSEIRELCNELSNLGKEVEDDLNKLNEKKENLLERIRSVIEKVSGDPGAALEDGKDHIWDGIKDSGLYEEIRAIVDKNTGTDDPLVSRREKAEKIATETIATVANKIGDKVKEGADNALDKLPSYDDIQKMREKYPLLSLLIDIKAHENPFYSTMSKSYNFYRAGGALESLIENKDLSDTERNAARLWKQGAKGLSHGLIDAVKGMAEVPKVLVKSKYGIPDTIRDIKDHISKYGPKDYDKGLKDWYDDRCKPLVDLDILLLRLRYDKKYAADFAIKKGKEGAEAIEEYLANHDPQEWFDDAYGGMGYIAGVVLAAVIGDEIGKAVKGTKAAKGMEGLSDDTERMAERHLDDAESAMENVGDDALKSGDDLAKGADDSADDVLKKVDDKADDLAKDGEKAAEDSKKGIGHKYTIDDFKKEMEELPHPELSDRKKENTKRS